jgi:hypothetical protein
MFICDNCGQEFTAQSNLCRHKKKSCHHKQDDKKKLNLTIDENVKLKNDLLLLESKNLDLEKKYTVLEKEANAKYLDLEKKYSVLEKENEYLKNDVTLYKSSYLKMLEQSFEKNLSMMDKTADLATINANNVTKSISTSKFITQRLTQAPPLIMNKKEVSGLLEYTPDKKYQPIDYIFSSYDNKELDKWIGDLIIKIYKKENPFDQSIWSTDTSRFSFLVCQVVQNASGKKNEWITDKSGHKVTEIIIDPTLELLKSKINLRKKNVT